MDTIALRFAENFAPEEGTIAAHEKVIDEFGYVWYGKRGSSISKEIKDTLLTNETPVILLIQSGKTKRYWAHIDEIQNEKPKDISIDFGPSSNNEHIKIVLEALLHA